MAYTYQGEYSFASGFVSLACFEVSSAKSLHSGSEGRGGRRGGRRGGGEEGGEEEGEEGRERDKK